MHLLSTKIIKHIFQFSHTHTLTAGRAPEHSVYWPASPAPWVLVQQDEVEKEVDEHMAGVAVGPDGHSAACNAADVH